MQEVIQNIVEDILAKGAAILDQTMNSSEAILNMAVTFGIQILATLVLFLFIRFKLWDKVTAMLEKRKKLIDENISKVEAAKKEIENASVIAEETKQASINKANQIIDNAKQEGEQEAALIIKSAYEKINSERAKMEAALAKERDELYTGIKNEIIDVACEIVKTVVDEESNENMQRENIKKVADKLVSK